MRAGVGAPLGPWGEQGCPASALPVTGPSRATPSIPSVLRLRLALSRVDPLESWAVWKLTTSLYVRVSHAPPAFCPRTAASSTAAVRPRSTRRTVRARARTRTSCSSSCRICSGRTRSWRCACAGLPPLGVCGVRIVLIGLTRACLSRLTLACGPGLLSLSLAGAGTQQRTPPRTPHPGLLAPEPFGGPGDRPRTAARSARLQIVLVLSRKTTPGRREPPGSTEGQWLSLTVSGVSTPR